MRGRFFLLPVNLSYNATMAIADMIFEKLTNEEDARLCLDIDEAACRESPQSFIIILSSYFLTKLGDTIANPKTTLAWLVTAVGAPAFVLGFLVPIRESGSMIPQLFIGSTIRQLPVRKWVWVAGCVMQGLCILGIGLVAFKLSGAAAGWSILVLITAFSLARGFCSVAAKDVLGKTIPKNKRGQLNGWSASGAGLLSVAVGVTLILATAESADVHILGFLLLCAGLLWILAAAIYTGIPETPGETGGGVRR